MGRATWLAIGLLAFLALVGLSLVWLHTPAGPRLDRVLAAPLIHDLPWWLRRLLSGLARRWLLIGLGALVALGLVRALRHRAYLAAVTALLVPALSLAWLSAIRDGWLFIGAADFPSGHTTLGAGLLVALAVAHPSLLKLPADLEAYAASSRAPLLINACETDPSFPAEACAKADEIFGEGRFVPGYERTWWEGCAHGFAVRADLVSRFRSFDSITAKVLSGIPTRTTLKGRRGKRAHSRRRSNFSRSISEQ